MGSLRGRRATRRDGALTQRPAATARRALCCGPIHCSEQHTLPVSHVLHTPRS